MIESRTRKVVHFRPSPPPSPKAGSPQATYSPLWGRSGYAAGNNKDLGSSSSHTNYSGNNNGDPIPSSTPNSRFRLLLTLFAIVVLSYVTIVNMFHRSLVVMKGSDTTINVATTTSLRGKPVTSLPLPDVATVPMKVNIPVTLAVRPAPLPSSSSSSSSSQLGAGLSAGKMKGVKSYTKLDLLSKSRPVTADVQGNLGAPSVVTNESIGNWLTDRWQAALNMKGEAIPGEHWIEIDLQRPCRVEKVIIDWEDAYSTFWTLQGRLIEPYISSSSSNGNNGNVILGLGGESKQIRHMKHHVVYELHTPFSRDQNRIKEKTLLAHKEHNTGMGEMVRYVRLVIHQPSMHWGSSIWRLQLWGTEAENTAAAAG